MLRMQTLSVEARKWVPGPAVRDGTQGSVASVNGDGTRDIYVFDCLGGISVVGIVRRATDSEYANVRAIGPERAELLRVLQRDGDSYSFLAKPTKWHGGMRLRVLHAMTAAAPGRAGNASPL